MADIEVVEPESVALPLRVYDLAKNQKNVGLFHSMVQLEFPELDFTRDKCRDFLYQVAEEERQDTTATCPTDSNYLERLANEGLYKELVLLLKEQKLYLDALEQTPPGHEVLLAGDNDSKDRSQISSMLRAVGSRIAGIRKDLVGAKQMKDMLGGGLTVNLNTMMSEAVGRMEKPIEVQVIP